MSDQVYTEKQINIKEFIESLFKTDPQPPYTYQLTDLPEKFDFKKFLANVLLTAAKELYNKELSQLDQSEIFVIGKYLQSLGWDAEYKVEHKQRVSDNGETETVNCYLIDFLPAKKT
jgi:hypothetical protein